MLQTHELRDRAVRMLERKFRRKVLDYRFVIIREPAGASKVYRCVNSETGDWIEIITIGKRIMMVSCFDGPAAERKARLDAQRLAEEV